MADVKNSLIEQCKSCIETLEVYTSGERVIIRTPSIIVYDGHDQHLTTRKGQVLYFEVEQTDMAFTHYCSGLEGLGYDTLPLREKYAGLRTKCDEVFAQR